MSIRRRVQILALAAAVAGTTYLYLFPEVLLHSESITQYLLTTSLPASLRIERELTKADKRRENAYAEADRDYRATVAWTFKYADRIEVFLLDFSMGTEPTYATNTGEGVFPVRPYEKEAKILKIVELAASDIPKWCTAMSQVLTSEKRGSQALCHFPIHGIRILAGDRVLFETSICWVCRNYYFSYSGESRWESLVASGDLEQLFEKVIPIPEFEKQRFSGQKTQ